MEHKDYRTYMLDQSTLVLESVALAQVVELVVKMLVDLAAGTILDQETAEDAKTAHPEDLRRHTGVGSTLSLSVATMTAFPSGKVQLASPRPRVHRDRLSDNEAIGNELSNCLARVGVGDFILLIGIQPNFALAAANDG